MCVGGKHDAALPLGHLALGILGTTDSMNDAEAAFLANNLAAPQKAKWKFIESHF